MEKQEYLIIGGSSGIGLETARKLSENGNGVILVSGSDEKLKSAFVQLSGKSHLTYRYDLKDIFHIEDIFKFIQKNGIRLNGMVYCAGIAPLCLLKNNTPQLMEDVFRINFFSMVECVRCFYQSKYSYEGSKIVAVSSTAAHTFGYRQVLYGSSKAAMVSSVRLMAKELLNRNIKINCISPGATDTQLLKSLYPDDMDLEEKFCSSQPLGIIPPEKVADVINILLSPVADYLTGTELIYDGGALLK